MINIILLSNGSNIMAEEIAREINVKKREGEQNKNKKKTQTYLWNRGANNSMVQFFQT